MLANRTTSRTPELNITKRQRAIRAALAAYKFKDPPPVTLPHIRGLAEPQNAEGSR